MKRVCPHCGASYEFKLAAPPSHCPRCGREVIHQAAQPTPSAPRQAAPPTQPGRVQGEYIPWEGGLDFLSRMAGTTWQVLFAPSRAFGGPARPGMRLAWRYAWMVSSLGFVLAWVLGYLAQPLIGGPAPAAPGGPAPPDLIHFLLRDLLGIVGPVILSVYTFGLPLAAAVVHLCLRLLRAGRAGFAATFQVLCYAQAAYIFQFIPAAGYFITLIWILAASTIGLSLRHQTGKLRALLALLMPLLLILVLAVYLLAHFAGSGQGLPGLQPIKLKP